MKNLLNHDGTGQLLLSNVDDGSNRIFINDVEIPSSSWVGTGNYTQNISGTTITIAKVADLDGNVMLQLVSANTYRLVKYVKAEYLTTTGDTKDNVTTFQSSDTTDALATAWTSVTKLNSGESHSSIFAKMSQMFKNIRYLYKMLGTTDISQIGGGNVTGAIASLNTSLTALDIHTIENSTYGNVRFFKRNKHVQAYAQLQNLPATYSVTLGSLPTSFIPKTAYAIGDVNSTAPYQSIGSLWIYQGGSVTLYKPTNITSCYVFIEYMTET